MAAHALGPPDRVGSVLSTISLVLGVGVLVVAIGLIGWALSGFLQYSDDPAPMTSPLTEGELWLMIGTAAVAAGLGGTALVRAIRQRTRYHRARTGLVFGMLGIIASALAWTMLHSCLGDNCWVA
jgi:hypothetical protein